MPVCATIPGDAEQASRYLVGAAGYDQRSRYTVLA